MGIHQSAPEDPDDPQSHPVSVTAPEDAVPNIVISISPTEASSAADPNERPPTMIGVDTPEEFSIDRPVVGDEAEVAAEDKKFWDWVTTKLGEIQDWFQSLGKEADGNQGE